MKYIVDAIGTSYQNWKAGDTIYISAPTGSGKTTFVLETLLPYLSMRSPQRKILYLVNRTILKEQIENDISKLSYELRKLIRVELYQTLEKCFIDSEMWTYYPDYWKGYMDAISNVALPEHRDNMLESVKRNLGRNTSNAFWQLKELAQYDYVVCDEAHYFLTDSNYNTNTYLSYKFVRDAYTPKVRIYMSATIDEIRKCVLEDNARYNNTRTGYFNFSTLKGRVHIQDKKFLLRDIDITSDFQNNYEYLDIHIINERSELAKIVTEDKNKWLIFVDNKNYGKSLKKDILAYVKDSDMREEAYVSFITSDYDMEEDALEEVGDIVKTSKVTSKILIATAVLDNGINIKDLELRNVVIMADTETEFIQMLGRKRQDGQKVQLYIYKYDRSHFQRRLRINKRRLKLAEESLRLVEKRIGAMSNMCGDIEQINREENSAIWNNHKYLMSNLMNHYISFDDINSLFLNYAGVWHLNLLSFQNVENLNQYYAKMLDEFEEYGEDAFAMKVLKWLNVTDEEIKSIIISEKMSLYEKSRTAVIDALNDIAGGSYTEKEIQEFQRKIQKDLLVLVDSVGPTHPEYKKYHDAAYKKGRKISSAFMRFLNKNCDIPFEIIVSNSMNTVNRIAE